MATDLQPSDREEQSGKHKQSANPPGLASDPQPPLSFADRSIGVQLDFAHCPHRNYLLRSLDFVWLALLPGDNCIIQRCETLR